MNIRKPYRGRPAAHARATPRVSREKEITAMTPTTKTRVLIELAGACGLALVSLSHKKRTALVFPLYCWHDGVWDNGTWEVFDPFASLPDAAMVGECERLRNESLTICRSGREWGADYMGPAEYHGISCSPGYPTEAEARTHAACRALGISTED